MKKYLVITTNEKYSLKIFQKKNLKKFCRLKNSSYICNTKIK